LKGSAKSVVIVDCFKDHKRPAILL